MSDRLPVVPDGAAAAPPTASDSAGPPADPARPPADPFPREQFVALVGRLPRYLRLAWGLAGEPRLSTAAKAGVLAAAAYLASPVDAIPGVIPVVGQLDDIAVALFALRAALRSLDPVTRERQLAVAGLAAEDLDRDLGTLAASAAWLARRGIAVGRRLGLLAATATVAAGRAGVGVVRRGAPVAARAGGRAARAAGGLLARPGRSAAAWARTRRGRPDAAAERDAGSGI